MTLNIKISNIISVILIVALLVAVFPLGAFANSSTDITAQVKHERTVTVKKPEHGSIIVVAPQQVYAGDKVTFTVTPDAGYKLESIKWYTTDPLDSTDITRAQFLIMPDADVTVVSKFVEKSSSSNIGGLLLLAGAVAAYSSCQMDKYCILNRFVDLNPNQWYHDGIHFCVEAGLMNGISANVFDPNGKTSRAMMMTILARMDGCDTENGETWYSIGMSWAKTNGISDGTNPSGYITREQFATMLYRYAKMQGEGFTGSWMFLLDFKDANQISSFANEAMHWCVMKGILNGKSNNMLDPQGLLTRAEAAAMIQRFMERER